MCDLDEVAEVADGTWRRARKTHECCACGETIRIGDRYHVEALLYDGHWTGYKHCARCWLMVEHLSRRSSGGVDLLLDCGVEYEAPPDDPGHELAFLTPDEAQTRLRA